MDIDYNELFGVGEAAPDTDTAPEAGAQDTGIEADTPVDNSAEAVTDGADDGKTASQGDVKDTDSGSDPVAAGKEPRSQSISERRGFAAARRRAEKDAEKRIEAARQEERAASRKVIDKILADGKIVDPATGKKITTFEEYEKNSEAIEKSRRESLLRRAGISEDELISVARETPEIKSALQRGQAAEEAARAAADAGAKADMEKQIAAIGKYDSSVKTLADVTKLPEFPEIYERVKRGYRLDDAYFVVNRDKIAAGERDRVAAAERQRTLNSRASKEHLSAADPRGKGAVTVPRDVMEQYRIFNPDATDAEIERHYRQQIKNKA